MRAHGYIVNVVEKWNAFARIRQDLYGCIDIVGMKEGVGIVGIQTTSGSNHSARVKKSMAEPRLALWLKCGGKFEVWSWAKKTQGKRKLWTVRKQAITHSGDTLSVSDVA